MTPQSLINDLIGIVGQGNILPGTPDGADTLVRPGSAIEVGACLRLIASSGQSVVTVGGGSGLVGGAEGEAGQIALSTARLNTIGPVAPHQRMLPVGAGAILSRVQVAAAAAGRRFGIDLGARDSCTIGGMVATNAGGIWAQRYGMMRRNVMGLQVVLADGTMVNDMAGLEKNNTGIDLSQCHIGAEGTLGVVTAAMLRLVARPLDSATALLGFDTASSALTAARGIEARANGQLSAAEIIWADFLSSAVRATGAIHPLVGHAVYLMVQVETHAAGTAEALLIESLADLAGLGDGVIATAGAQEAKLWALRDASDPAERLHRHVISFDVSLRPDTHEEYLTDVLEGLKALDPNLVIYSFGHLLDGNVHLVVASDSDIDNVTEGLTQVKGMRKTEARERAADCLTRVGLGDRLNYYPTQLSGGQQQRAAIARAIAMEPQAILFDEPTSALDPELVREVLRVIEELAGENRTMIIVTHEMSFARSVADHVAFLHKGLIIEQGAPDAVFGSPQTPELRRFLDHVA